MLWGGTSFNFGKDMGRLDDYISQTQRMRQVAARLGVDVFLSNHPGFDDTLPKLAALRGKPAGGNPFVSGTAVVDRSLQVLGECARAQKVRFQIP